LLAGVPEVYGPPTSFLLSSLFPSIRYQRHEAGALDGTAEQALVLGAHASTLTGDNFKLTSGKLLE